MQSILERGTIGRSTGVYYDPVCPEFAKLALRVATQEKPSCQT